MTEPSRSSARSRFPRSLGNARQNLLGVCLGAEQVELGRLVVVAFGHLPPPGALWIAPASLGLLARCAAHRLRRFNPWAPAPVDLWANIRRRRVSSASVISPRANRVSKIAPEDSDDSAIEAVRWDQASHSAPRTSTAMIIAVATIVATVIAQPPDA